MAKDNKKLVQAITSQEDNFAQWYTDICVKAELVEYSSVKGFIILRPYGQAIWELIQKDMDARFKATGHENVARPSAPPARPCSAITGPGCCTATVSCP